MFETKKKYYSPTVKVCTFGSSSILAGSGPLEEITEDPGGEPAAKQNHIFSSSNDETGW